MIIDTNFPNDLLHIILDYDGRIKYKKGTYVNIIHKHDERYNIIQGIISKKLEIMKRITFDNGSRDGPGFYFEFGFDINNSMGLCYDYNFSYANKFEICYYDWRNVSIKQIRTYL